LKTLSEKSSFFRVFNYYLYPELYTGYIIMELVKGLDIEEYLAKNPEDINEIFAQAIEGFTHLEKNQILHRDIRPMNILVSDNGQLKLIDFGFGKQVFAHKDFGKSISLNWWCEPPSEFSDEVYDYTTEVYFVGKLFEKIIKEQEVEHFKYLTVLSRMCHKDPNKRIRSFPEVKKELLTDKFIGINFNQSELAAYREFSDGLAKVVSEIEQNTKYIDDENEIQRNIEKCYKKVMLEEYIPHNPLIVKCFLNGSYYYSLKHFFPVNSLKAFLELFRSCSREKRNIIISNLQTKLDSIKRYDEMANLDDDIPF